jgi:hypothetical protein
VVSGIDPQVAISLSVLKQPLQNPLCGFMVQIELQGEGAPLGFAAIT